MNLQPLVLVVEDEDDIASLLEFSLAQVGFATRRANNLESARVAVEAVLPDVVLLDWMLPDGAGVEWLHQLRHNSRTRGVPVLMLTARAQEADKLLGLEGGADDYITKPFSPKELMARIQTVLRRVAPQHAATQITFLHCVLDDDNHTLRQASSVEGGGRSEVIGNTEYKLLKFFLTHPNKTYSRTQLLDMVWGDHVFIEERTVDVHILRLRKILQRFAIDTHLETVRGIGYRWQADATDLAR